MLSDFPQVRRRAHLVELMDGPCPESECIRCLIDLNHANRVLFAYRPTLKWLRQFVGEQGQPLRIVDIGCGAGDMLRSIEGWASLQNLPVELTGIDLNPSAVKAARQLSSPDSRIRWICSEALAFEPDCQVDLIISSLFTHHLNDDEIVRFLQWMERVAIRGWLINDLERSLASYYGFKLLARLMRWHPFVRHDGSVSILRSFTFREWFEYIPRAGLNSEQVAIFRARPGRLCVSRVK